MQCCIVFPGVCGCWPVVWSLIGGFTVQWFCGVSLVFFFIVNGGWAGGLW